MTSYQRERQALGERLRELRKDARLTGVALAERHGWPASKVSKIEAGKQTPSDADLEVWAASCGAAGQAPSLVLALRSLESHYQEYRRQLRDGLGPNQRRFREREGQATVIRSFCSMIVAGLLQTPEYTRAMLAGAGAFVGVTGDVEAAVAERMARQQVLYRRDRRVHIVLCEAALRFRLAPLDVLAGQLDKLIGAASMHSLRLGIIPFDAEYGNVAPLHGFDVYDEELVRVETMTAELVLGDPDEVAGYLRCFSDLARRAVYGADARALIGGVLSEIAPAGD